MITAHDKGMAAHGIIKVIKVYFIKNYTELHDVTSAVLLGVALFACFI